jgi:uncharacterized protein (TIGR00255 family)
MALMSMTGFARADGGGDIVRWAWELRSVNGKGLDVRVRLPAGLDRLEPGVRERCASHLTRGNIQVALSTSAGTEGQRLTINEEVLATFLDAMERIGQKLAVQPPTLDGILALRGVVEVEDRVADEATREALDAELLVGLDAGLEGLVAMREREGTAIGTVLAARLDEMGELTDNAEASPARAPETIRARLAEQIATLLDAAPALDPDRLYQEAVILATKADIREELDRLHAHISAARDLLAKGGPVGRRLDFLAQEFGREVNTLCAKSNDRTLTAIGLDMKAVVDQMREQIQNLE